jgi:NitT/TauT family transport system substrate-binding protein
MTYRHKERLVRPLLAALAIGLVSFVGQGASAADKVRIATAVSWPGYSFWEIVVQKNLAPDLELEVIVLNDPVAGYGMLAAGQFDVYSSTIDYAPIAAEQDMGIKQVSLAGLSYGVDHVLLAPDITPEDVRGTRVAAPVAFVGQLMVAHWLALQGIGPDEVEWVDLNADDAAGAMIGGDLTVSYMYEPWTTNIQTALPGATIAVKSNSPEIVQTAMIGDALYMSDAFITEHRDIAIKLMKAYWDAVQWWRENPAEGNQIMTDYLQWPLADTEFVMGKDGTGLDVEGLYEFNFDQAAQICGVLEGEPPLGLKNGQIAETFAIVTERWRELGLISGEPALEEGVDCSIMGDLVEAGYTNQ